MEPKIRKLQVLSAIIESYVETGEPVGSKLLAELLGNSVSSATIRNDMASLAESGYLDQPHTSAGRLPTQRGYRVYVDQLMSRRTLPQELMRQLDIQLTGISMDPAKFLAEASHMLSVMTGLAAIATTPSLDDARVTGAELMATGQHTCLVMIMIAPSTLKTRMCRMDIDLTGDTLDGLRRILRTAICGRRLSELTPKYIRMLKAQLGPLGDTVEPLLTSAVDAAADGSTAQITLDGQTYLLDNRAFSAESLRDILGFLSDRSRLSQLFNEAHSSMNIYIGTESGFHELSDASVITARYCSSGGASGWVGVIGPQRMNYSRIIPYIEYFSTAVGRLMSALETDGDKNIPPV